MAIALQNTVSGAILYDSARIGKPSDAIFTAAYWAERNAVTAQSGGRGGVLFLRNEAEQWVLRHYHRGGLVAKFISDRYLWLGAERTRAFREWRLLHRMRELDLPVPTPVATRFVRQGLFYTADLITESLPQTTTLAAAMAARLPERVWFEVGRTISRFHRHGIRHADLNAHNILLGANHSIFVLDFDRGWMGDRGPWEVSVLERLRRSLRKVSVAKPLNFTTHEWAELLRGYYGGNSPDRSSQDSQPSVL